MEKPASPKKHLNPSLALKNQLGQLRTLVNEYPRQFWVLVFSAFIDRLGGALLFPFFSLYITKKFGVGMTEVGILFAIFSVTGIISGLLGGALTDRMGRKGILVFGLVMSALSALLMGLMDNFVMFVVVVVVVGLLADMGGPAQQAMVADLLPEKKRAQGYGILRVVFNLAVVIGPLAGGLLAARSYLLLFIIDTITSLLTAGIVVVAIRETKKPPQEDEPQESVGQTFKGYLKVLRDSSFVWFLGASMLSVLVYMLMTTTLAVYLRDSHGISEQMFSYILSLNAILVVLFQFPITRWISRFRPLMIMVVGTLLYAIGFGMYGLVSIYPLFLLAMVVITIGEMLVSPVSQSIVSTLAPEDMRGRYMATYGFSWVIPASVGPLLAGLVMDNLDPRWIWYAAFFVGLASTAVYYLLERRIGGTRWEAIDRRLEIIEQLEEGKINAEEAAAHLAHIQDSKWARLTSRAKQKEHAQVRFRLSNLGTGEVQKEFYMPLGLLNTILNTDCRLSTDLEGAVEMRKLRELITQSATTKTASLEGEAGQRVDISRE